MSWTDGKAYDGSSSFVSTTVQGREAMRANVFQRLTYERESFEADVHAAYEVGYVSLDEARGLLSGFWLDKLEALDVKLERAPSKRAMQLTGALPGGS